MNDKSHNQRVQFRPFFLLCGFLMAASEIWKQLYLTFSVNGGSYDWWYFPFQLCSMPMYVLLVLPHIKKGRLREALLVFLMCYGTLGGIAVFADTSGLHYPVISLTVHSYLWHILQIAAGFLAVDSFRQESAAHHPRKSFADASFLYLLFCAAASLINGLVSPHAAINMFYINPRYRMEQVIFRLLVPHIGNNAAILIYIGSTILGAGILFLFWNFLIHPRTYIVNMLSLLFLFLLSTRLFSTAFCKQMLLFSVHIPLPSCF